jgi:hypothetical protein
MCSFNLVVLHHNQPTPRHCGSVRRQEWNVVPLCRALARNPWFIFTYAHCIEYRTTAHDTERTLASWSLIRSSSRYKRTRKFNTGYRARNNITVSHHIVNYLISLPSPNWLEMWLLGLHVSHRIKLGNVPDQQLDNIRSLPMILCDCSRVASA